MEFDWESVEVIEAGFKYTKVFFLGLVAVIKKKNLKKEFVQQEVTV